MANKYMKRSSTSLAIREMFIKNATRYYFTLTKMAVIRNTDNNKCLQGCGEKLEHLYTAYRNAKRVKPLGKSLEVLQKLNIKKRGGASST